MEIIIEGPYFRSPDDEDEFFNLIYSLESFSEAKGIGTKIHVFLSKPINSGLIGQLNSICQRWQTNYQLIQPNNE